MTAADAEPGTPFRRGSIVARLILAVAAPAALVVIALGVLTWQATQRAVLESLDRELLATVVVAASTVNPVPARILLAGDEGTRSYRRLVARLHNIQESTGTVSLMLIGQDESVRADGRGALPLLSPAPRLALDRAEFSRALAGQPAVSVPFTGDDGRRYLAAYARVPEPTGDDALGEPPGMPVLLAMEAPAAALDATDTVARRIVLLVSLAVLSVLALSVVVARTITRPLLRLSRSAEALGRGDLKHPLSLPRGDDEVARLGRALEAMRHALDDRDAERQMMLAGIAHEVRNPLGGMELFSGLLEEALVELPPSTSEPARAELLHHARRVRKELQYLTGVVNDFLAFARDTPLQREDVDVGALLEDVTSLCARAGSAALVRDDAFRGAFPLDRGRIKQALLNLVENALAATPPDGTITVRAKRGAQGGLVLEVEDRGRGMDAGTLASAFTPFYTTKEKGSGLGLPLVRKLARDHGGDACLASTPGRGTTVTLTLEPDERPLA